MKKLIAFLLVIVLLASFVGCSKSQQDPADPAAPSADASTPSEDATAPAEDAAAPSEDSAPSEDTAPDAEDAKYGGHLNFISEMVPTNLDPAKSTGVYKYMYTNLAYEAPLTRDVEGNIAPNVCDFELSEDGLTLKLWVVEGKTFHDGTPVEIEDVVASVQRAVHKSPRQYVSEYIQDVTVEDGVATFTFTEYSEKTMYYIACVHPFIGVMPKEICEKYTYENEQIIMDPVDAIGTGPYKFVELIPDVSVTLERYEDYIPVDQGTGPAAPKMGYLDSISFIANTDYSSIAMTLMGGDADLAENISQDYRDQAAAAGIKVNAIDYTAGLAITFNTFGNNPTSANADLRKAVLAAIDIPELVDFLHKDAYSVGGGPVLDKAYYREIFDTVDYMGEDKQDVVDAYLEAAGYNGETLSFVCPSSASSWATMIEAYLSAAGITIKTESMEEEAWNEFIADPNNDWDFYMGYPSLNNTPVLLNDNVMKTWYNSPEKDALLEALSGQLAGSADYMATWDQLAEQMVDDCAVVVLGQSKLEWFMSEDLNFDYEGRLPFLWNAYWTNPADHAK